MILQPLAGIDQKHMHPSILPADIKQKIINHYSEYYSEYKELDYLLNNMNVQDSSHLLPETLKRIVHIDKNRNKDFYKTFPEYKDLFKGIKE